MRYWQNSHSIIMLHPPAIATFPLSRSTFLCAPYVTPSPFYHVPVCSGSLLVPSLGLTPSFTHSADVSPFDRTACSLPSATCLGSVFRHFHDRRVPFLTIATRTLIPFRELVSFFLSFTASCSVLALLSVSELDCYDVVPNVCTPIGSRGCI